MSSLIRRIERTVVPSQPVHIRLDLDGEPKRNERGGLIYYANPPKTRNYLNRGVKLGVKNPKDATRIARERREAARRG